MPDFRPQHDMQRTPWWKRHVRPDFLSLQFTDTSIQTTFQTGEAIQKYTLECRSIDAFYYENENDLSLQIGRAGVDEKYASLISDGYNWPRYDLCNV